MTFHRLFFFVQVLNDVNLYFLHFNSEMAIIDFGKRSENRKKKKRFISFFMCWFLMLFVLIAEDIWDIIGVLGRRWKSCSGKFEKL